MINSNFLVINNVLSPINMFQNMKMFADDDIIEKPLKLVNGLIEIYHLHKNNSHAS